MKNWAEHDDPYSRALFDAFHTALQPILDSIDKRWQVHHLELVRPGPDFRTMEERVEIRIIIKTDMRKLPNEQRTAQTLPNP